MNSSNYFDFNPFQEDLVSLGKIVLALSCNSFIAIQRENIQQSMELVTTHYSNDLRNLIMYLLTNSQRAKSVNDLMPMIGQTSGLPSHSEQSDLFFIRSKILHSTGQLHAENRSVRGRTTERHRVSQDVQVSAVQWESVG